MAVTVTISEHVRDRIWRTIRETADGRETGGALLGFERDGTIVIDDAGGIDWFGEQVSRSPITVLLSAEWALELEQTHREIGSPARWIGEWHSHDYGGARPSEGDYGSWLTGLCHFGAFWVGMIATPGAPGSPGEPGQPVPSRWVDAPPQLHAWVVRRLPGAPGARYRACYLPAAVTVSSSALDPILGQAA